MHLNVLVAFCLIFSLLVSRVLCDCRKRDNFLLVFPGRKLLSEPAYMFARLQGGEWHVEESESYSIAMAKKHLG